MQKVDPPAQVIDSFRDVQAARADLERAQNEGADLRQPGRAGSARPRRADHAGGRSLSRADGRGRTRQGVALRQGLRANTRRRRTSRASASISRRWSACSAAPTRSSSISPGRSGGNNGSGVVPVLPLNEMIKRRGDDGRHSNEARYRWRRSRRSRRHRGDRRLFRRCSPSIRRGSRSWCGSASRCASSPSRA